MNKFGFASVDVIIVIGKYPNSPGIMEKQPIKWSMILTITVVVTSRKVAGMCDFIPLIIFPKRKMFKTSLSNLLQELHNEDADRSRSILNIIDYFKSFEIPQQQLVGCWEQIRPFTTGQYQEEAYSWIQCCLAYHYDDCDLLRLDFFKVIAQNEHILESNLQIIKVLTKEGRDLRNFEHDIGPLLSKWILKMNDASSLIQFITNFIKFSFVYVNEAELLVIFDGIKYWFNSNSLRLACLGFLDAVGRYGYIPSPSVDLFVDIICLGVQDRECEMTAWPIFKNTLVSHSAISAFQSVLSILYHSDKDILTLMGALEVIKRGYQEQLFPQYGSSVVLKVFEFESGFKIVFESPRRKNCGVDTALYNFMSIWVSRLFGL
jgi:hypothetical protein